MIQRRYKHDGSYRERLGTAGVKYNCTCTGQYGSGKRRHLYTLEIAAQKSRYQVNWQYLPSRPNLIRDNGLVGDYT